MRNDVNYILSSQLGILKERIIANHISAGQKASGRTIASLKVLMDDTSGTLFGDKSLKGAPIGTLETGRKAGKVPQGFYKIILQWALDKGITVDGNIKSFAYFVAKKIASEGTGLFKSGGRKDIYSNEIPLTIENIKRLLTERFTTELTNIKIN